MKSFKILFLVFISLFPSLLYSFESSSLNLNNGTVHHLLRSKDGFMWIATDIGISRYDGFRYRNFPLKDLENSSSSNGTQAVNAIYENEDGLLFLQLQQGGVACFNYRSEQYIPIHFTGASFDKQKILSIYVADKLLLYIGTTTGLYCAEVKVMDKGKKKELELSLSKPLLTGHISEIISDKKGNLFLCIGSDSDKVLLYSMGTQQTQEIAMRDYKNRSNSNTSISTIFLSGNYLLIFRKYATPICYNIRENKSSLLLNTVSEGNTNLSDLYVTDIEDEGNGQTFYLSTSNGLYSLQFNSKALEKTEPILERISDTKQISTSLWDNPNEILWSGLNGTGIKKIKANKNNREQHIFLPFESGANGMEEDTKGYIWLVAERKGIWRSTTPSISPNLTFDHWTKEGNSKETYCIFKDRNGNLWFGDEHANIIFINPVSGESKTFRLNPDDLTNFSASIKELYLDNQNRLWVITSNGLVLLDHKSGSCSLIIKNSPTTGMKVNSVSGDSENNIWLGTTDGIKRLNMLPGKVEMIGTYEKEARWESGSVHKVYVNRANQVWALYTDKILRIDSKKGNEVTVYPLQENLKDGHVVCIADDEKGNTWMGCTSGIIVANNNQKTLYSVFSGESCKSVCALKNKYMLWSNSYELFYFSPIGKSTQRNKLWLSDICVNGNSISLNKSNNDHFVFNDNVSLQFYFTDLLFSNAEQAITYRLLPDEEWKSGTLEKGILYNNLPSGNYTLQVKLIYPDATEGDILELSLVIQSTMWQSGWAHAIYALLIICLLVAAYYFFDKRGKISKIKSRNNQKTNNKQNSNLPPLAPTSMYMSDILLNRFIQELHTPLTTMSGSLKEVIQSKGKISDIRSKILTAYRNSIGIQRACDQLLDILNQKNINKHLSVAPYVVSDVIDTFLFSMNELLHVYSIEFEYNKEKSDTKIWIDKDKIDFLLRNLLWNTLVHIRYVGKITLSICKITEGNESYCRLTLSDNGKCTVKNLEEITESELKENESVMVMIGLDIIKEIVRLHHGTLTIENDPEKGTSVIVKLPTNKSLFSNDQNVEFVAPQELKRPEFSVENIIEVEKEQEDEDLTFISEVTSSEKEEREKKTILIIEDYTDIRLYLKVLFEKEYNVLQADNGVEGVKIAKKELPDLIISDIMMPLKDGYQCCKEIKEGLDTCHIPFIMLTAKIEDEDVVKGLEIGADDYILKPFKPNILKARVKSLILARVGLKQMYTELLTPSFTNTEEQAEKEATANIEDPFISSVIKIIEENMQEEDFNVKKLASDLNMSQPTLYRKVKQYTDFTIIELIRGVRLKKAATLLQTKRYGVQEVAEMVGYNDIPTFRKHFVDMYGTTPSTYAGK